MNQPSDPLTPGAEPLAQEAPTVSEPTMVVKALATDAVGSTLGRYKLLEKIGEGGCGEVYVAEQSEPVRRRVALKVIKLGMDTRQVVARFEAERQALAMMDHPNIAKVLDAGTTEAGRPFFVMELVRGIKITDYCDEHRLSTRERLDLFVQVCRAIQHAHQKGIIHRDIKPSNILVTLHDGTPVPKVIDFGIAKAIEGRLTDATVYTQLHQFMGTPAYMSPEQAEMTGLDIDTRSDIYSLGVLLYELLAGRTPFDPAELLSVGLDAMRRTIREKDPVRPSTRLAMLREDELTTTAKRRSSLPPKLIHGIKGDLDWIAMKCLEKDRTRRYETANGLAVDVERYLDGQPVIAAPPGTAYRLRKFVLRHRGAVAAGAALACLLVAGVIAFAWQASIARRQRDRAVAAEAETRKRAEQTAKIAEFQARMLSGIDVTEAGTKLMEHIRASFEAALRKSGVAEAQLATNAENFRRDLGRVNATDTAAELIERTILKPAIKAVDTEFKDQPEIEARLRHTLADLYRVLGLYDQALPLEEQALETRRRVLGPDHPDTLTSLNVMGSLLESKGRTAEAEQCFREAWEKRGRILGTNSEAALTSLGDLGNCLRTEGKFAEAEPLLRADVEQSRRVLGPEHRDTLIAMNCLGYLLISKGKLAEAEPLWRESYQTGRRALGEDDPDVLIWMNNLAGLMQEQGKFKEAEPLFREALEKFRRLKGEEHPSTIQLLTVVGGMLTRQGRYAEAEPLLREALEKSRRVFGPDNPVTLSILSEIAALLFRQGQYGDAEPLFRQVLETRQRTLAADNPATVVAMTELASLLTSEGKLTESEKLLREALETQKRIFPADHPDTLTTMLQLGNVLSQEKHFDEAEKLIRDTLAARRRISGEGHPETLIALSHLGRLLDNAEKFPEAEAAYREALEGFRKAQGKDHPNTLNGIANLAAVVLEENRATDAEALYRDAFAGMARKLGTNHMYTASARVGLGKALLAQNRFTEAETELIEAHRALSQGQGVPVLRQEKCLKSLVALYQAWDKAQPGQGRDAKAAEWSQKLAAVAH